MSGPSITQKIHLLSAAIVALILATVAWVAWSEWQVVGISDNASASVPIPSPSALPVEQQFVSNHVIGFRPAYLLQIHATPLPELQAWAKDWKSETSMDLSRLAGLIEKSDLSAVECLQIGSMIAHDEGYPAGKVWIAAGYHRAYAQFTTSERGHNSLRLLLSSLVAAENSLEGRVDTASLLEQLNSLIMRFGRSNDWDQTPEWARLHHVDALRLEGRNVEAKVEAEAMSRDAETNRHWTPQLKMEMKLTIARIPFEAEAKCPMDVLRAHSPQPQKLVAWMEVWQTSRVIDQADQNTSIMELNRSNLLDLIGKSDLSAMECLRISDLMADAADKLDSETFASIGTDRAVTELADIRSDDVAARPLLNALKRADDRLWESPGSAVARGATLEKITLILMRFVRENPWDQTPEWARIGHGEALYLQQRYSEALAEANGLATDATTDRHFTNQQKIGIDWLQAIVLFDTGRYQDAVPHLESTATHPAFAYASDAWPLWAVALAKTGDAAHANRVFDDWIRQDRPPVVVAARVLDVIQGQQTH